MTDEKNINDMMFCEECGTKIKKGVKFCENCGIQIKYIDGRPLFYKKKNNEQEQQMISHHQQITIQQNQEKQLAASNNPFGDTYVSKPVNANLIKMIIIAVCASLLVLIWMCAPVIQIDYMNSLSGIVDLFSSSDNGNALTIAKLFELANNLIKHVDGMPDEFQTVLTLIALMLLVIIVFVIFAIIFIYGLIKMDVKTVKENAPRITMCTFVFMLFLLCLVMVLNGMVENDYIDIMNFGLGAGSYIIIILTVVIQCIASSLIIDKEKKKEKSFEQDIQREYWVCPTCGTNNPGNEFCYKCGFENRVVTTK